MKTKYLILMLLSFSLVAFGEDQRVKLKKFLNEYPSVQMKADEKLKVKLIEAKKVFLSDKLNTIDIKSLQIEKGAIHRFGNLVKLKSQATKKVSRSVYHGKFRLSLGRAIALWQVGLPVDGDYFILQESYRGVEGLLNSNQNIFVHKGGLVSLKGKNQISIPLKKGSQSLLIAKHVQTKTNLYFVNKIDLESSQQDFISRIYSKEEKDLHWVFNQVLPSIACASIVPTTHLKMILELPHIKDYIGKNKELVASKIGPLFKNISYPNQYKLHHYLYVSHFDLYFTKVTKVSGRGARPYYLFNPTNPYHRIYNLLAYYSYNDVFDKPEEFIKQVLKVLEKDPAVKNLDLEKATIYTRYWITLSRTGNVGHATRIKAKYENLFKKLLPNKSRVAKFYKDMVYYIGSSHKEANELVVDDATVEIEVMKIRNLLLTYDGDAVSLNKLFSLFTSLEDKFVTFSDDFFSLKFNFTYHAKKNKKFIFDFKALCKLKLSKKLKKILDSGTIDSKEEFLQKFSDFMNLSQLRLSLFLDYYSKGAIIKALSQGRWLTKNAPSLAASILPKLKAIEEFTDTPNNLRLDIPEDQKGRTFKKKGKNVSFKSLVVDINTKKGKSGLGKLLSNIFLENSHRQYWDHPLINYHQGVEPTFSATKLYLAGSSYLKIYDLAKNKIIDNKENKSEFYFAGERGPHQKHFFAQPLGSNVLFLSNRPNSVKKTLRCFSSDGEIVWDIVDENNTIEIDPISMPIEAGGFLLLFSYDGTSAIKSVKLFVVDPNTGKILKSFILSMIENNIFSGLGRETISNWNTYRHDNHFVKDDSGVYAFTGTGVIVKINTDSQEIAWGKALNTARYQDQHEFYNHLAYSPSGFIKIFDQIVVAFTPGVQTFVGINKYSGKTKWRTHLIHPRFIHGRNQSKAIYYSSQLKHEVSWITKLDPETGKKVWSKSMNGLKPLGEGDLIRGKLYIPCQKSIVVLNADTGDFIQSIKLKVQPLKIRFKNGYWVILTKNNAYLLADDGDWSSDALQVNTIEKNIVIQEDANNKVYFLPYKNISLEKAIYLPQLNYTEKNNLKRTVVLGTANQFYHVMKSGVHLSLFREGFNRKDGKPVSPNLIWYENLPYHFLFKDHIVVSEVGSVRCQEIISRKTIWTYQYSVIETVVQGNLRKNNPIVSGSKKYVIFKSRENVLTVLNKLTGKMIFEFECPGVKRLKIKNHVVATYNGRNVIGYDLNQKGKEIWRHKFHYSVIFDTFSKGFVIHKAEHKLIELLDATTGKKISILKHPDFRYGIYKGIYESEKYYSLMNLLFDKKTNKIISQYPEVYPLGKGNYFCFHKKFGNVGTLILSNKKIPFKVFAGRSSYNGNVSVIQRGNRIGFFSLGFFETLEIKNNRLESIDVTYFQGGRRESTHPDTILFSLTNSLLRLNTTQMSFFRNFDPYHQYKKIKTFRVLNTKNFEWPFDEFYPEVKVTKNNWISDNGSVPGREMSYQIGADQNYVYMRYKLAPSMDSKNSYKLFISTISAIGIGVFTWDPDLWNHSTSSHNFSKRIRSWKEEHSDGTIYLNFKIHLKETYAKANFNTIPEFSIELRQYKKGVENGCYRFGGTFVDGLKFFQWVDRSIDESQAVKSFRLRNKIYQKPNFYPQGLELLKWISDRRKFYSIKNNITFLNKLLKKNIHNVCSINILAVLLQEELALFKKQKPFILATTAKFKELILNKIISCNETAVLAGMNENWRKLALTLWCFDVFPRKTTGVYGNTMVIGRYELYGSPGLKLSSSQMNFSNPMRAQVNTPYLEIISPGLFSGYLRDYVIFDKINFLFIPFNTNCGEIVQYGISGPKTLVDQKGNVSSKYKLSLKPINPNGKNNYYHFRSKSNMKHQSWFTVSLGGERFDLKKNMPSITYDSALSVLSNLPSDSYLGYSIINSLGSLNAILSLEQRQRIYVSWLKRVKQNFITATDRGIYLLRLLPKDINKFVFIKKICQEAKVQRNIQRYYNMYFSNFYLSKHKRSLLGPFTDNMTIAPEVDLNINTAYTDKKLKMKFSDNFRAGKGQIGYIAIKITSDKLKRVYFHSIATKSYDQSVLTLWVNKKEVMNKGYIEGKNKMISKKIRLKKGDNIILLKLENRSIWNNFSFVFGDKNGAPIEGLKFSKMH
ncbi:MAG: hypothetical protein COA79_08045 [Planctomycetota bacterium]|nr:MAG: hypothetical protein COA79_08045 [Planctomycetota bacterium]